MERYVFRFLTEGEENKILSQLNKTKVNYDFNISFNERVFSFSKPLDKTTRYFLESYGGVEEQEQIEEQIQITEDEEPKVLLLDSIIEKLHHWISEELSKEDIYKVLWAIAETREDEELIAAIQEFRAELDSERVELDEASTGVMKMYAKQYGDAEKSGDLEKGRFKPYTSTKGEDEETIDEVSTSAAKLYSRQYDDAEESGDLESGKFKPYTNSQEDEIVDEVIKEGEFDESDEEKNEESTIENKLRELTDEELVKKYNKLCEHHNLERSMDGSGELGHIIDETFEPYYEAYYKEFDRREINPKEFLPESKDLEGESEGESDEEFNFFILKDDERTESGWPMASDKPFIIKGYATLDEAEEDYEKNYQNKDYDIYSKHWMIRNSYDYKDKSLWVTKEELTEIRKPLVNYLKKN